MRASIADTLQAASKYIHEMNGSFEVDATDFFLKEAARENDLCRTLSERPAGRVTIRFFFVAVIFTEDFGKQHGRDFRT
ncbi:MAG TPA: hypothetical protein VLL07_05785 [Pontiella sp.]|nr:hypothetical protein [Pontiella sp.]